MKITKSQLKQIIQEELSSLTRENKDSWYDDEYETLADRKFADRPQDPDSDADDEAELNDIVNQYKELVNDYDIDYPDDGGFFLSLVRESGRYLEPREQELAQQMRDACVQILLTATQNT